MKTVCGVTWKETKNYSAGGRPCRRAWIQRASLQAGVTPAGNLIAPLIVLATAWCRRLRKKEQERGWRTVRVVVIGCGKGRKEGKAANSLRERETFRWWDDERFATERWKMAVAMGVAGGKIRDGLQVAVMALLPARKSVQLLERLNARSRG